MLYPFFFFFFNSSHPDRYKVISHCGFHLGFTDDNAEHFSWCLAVWKGTLCVWDFWHTPCQATHRLLLQIFHKGGCEISPLFLRYTLSQISKSYALELLWMFTETKGNLMKCFPKTLSWPTPSMSEISTRGPHSLGSVGYGHSEGRIIPGRLRTLGEIKNKLIPRWENRGLSNEMTQPRSHQKNRARQRTRKKLAGSFHRGNAWSYTVSRRMRRHPQINTCWEPTWM